MTVNDFVSGMDASSRLVGNDPVNITVLDRNGNPLEGGDHEIRSASFTTVDGVQLIELRCW